MALAEKVCAPCEGGTTPMDNEEIQASLEELNNSSEEARQNPWRVTDDGKAITKEYKLKDFVAAVDLTNQIKDVAEAEGHHPDLGVYYGKVAIKITTHAIGGLSENDFILGAKIDQLR